MGRVAARANAELRTESLGPRWSGRVCAWCGEEMPAHREGPGLPASHGICPPCLADLLAELPPAAGFRAEARAVPATGARRR